MSMDALIFIKFSFALISILIIGYSVLRLVFRPVNGVGPGEIIVLSFALGVGFVGFEMFVFFIMNSALSISRFLLIQIPVVALSLIKFKAKFFTWPRIIRLEKPVSSILSVILVSVITINIIYVFLDALSLPFVNWDTWANWGFKAKIFYIGKEASLRLLNIMPWVKHPNHLEYPLLIPFVETYIYCFLGQVQESLVRFFCSLFYLGSIIIFYFRLRDQFSRKFSLGGCFCLVSIPHFSQMASSGYMELPIVFFITSSILYIWKYLLMPRKDDAFLLLGCFLLGLGMWVKNEGLSFWIALFLSCVIVCWKFNLAINKKKFLFCIFSIPLVIFSPWLWFKYISGISGDMFKASYLKDFFNNFSTPVRERIPLILNIWTSEGANISRWNIFWFVFIFVLIWFILKPCKKPALFLLCIAVFQISFIFVVYIVWPVTLDSIRSYIFQSVDRLLLQLAPLLLFFICQQVGEEFPASS